MTTTLEIIRPDDWHVHFRQGDRIANVVNFTAARFGRVLAMPNTQPPIRTLADAITYDEDVRACAHAYANRFTPHYALYLTTETTPEQVREAAQTQYREKFVLGYKLYPQGATTNSADGVSVHNLEVVYPIFAEIAKSGLTLMIHGEIPGDDPFDRERNFIDGILVKILDEFGSDLRITFEHVTSRDGVAIVKEHSNLAATVTGHHLLHDRAVLFDGGLSPHHYCLPVLKTEADRRAILVAAVDHHRFFLGTDSAPHPRRLKESRKAPAGCFTAPVGIELYAEVFDAVGTLGALEAFASRRGAEWYGLPLNSDTIRIERIDTPPSPVGPYRHYAFGNDIVVCPWSDVADRWKVVNGV